MEKLPPPSIFYPPSSSSDSPKAFDLRPYFEGIEKRVLDNGLTSLVYSDKRFPIISFHLWVRTGPLFEGRFLGTGISHYLEHALFLGSKQRSKVGQYSKEVEMLGGADNNAHTSFEHTAFYFTLSSGHLEKGLDLLADLVLHPLFPEARLKKEKNVVLAEMSMDEDDPDSLISRDFMDKFYPNHPYRVPIIGYPEAFKKITRDDLIEYHHSRYSSDQMVLAVFGDIENEEVWEAVDRIFGKAPRREVSRPTLFNESAFPHGHFSVKHLDMEKPRFRISYPIVSQEHPDAPVFDVLETLLSWGRDSWLYKKYISQGYFLSLESQSWTPTCSGSFDLQATLDDLHGVDAKDLIAQLKDDLSKAFEYFTEEDLIAARYKTLAESVGAIESISGLAHSAVSGEIFGRQYDFEVSNMAKLQEVTLEDLKRICLTYLMPEKSATVLYLPDTPEYHESSKVTHTAKQETLKSFQKKILTNGSVLLTPEVPRSSMNAMAIVFRGGQQYETLAQLGLFNMFSRMLLEGAGSLNREEIARRLEDRGGLVNSFSGSNSFGFTFSYFPEYEEKILSTTLEFLQNPTFPEHALKILKDKMTEGLELLDESVVDVSQKILRKNLYGEHPYAYLLRGEASTIANLSREDLINTQKKFILASNMVAAVSGTISPRIENFLNQIRGDVWEQQPNPFSRLPLPKDPILMEIDKDQKIYHLAFYSPELGHEDIPALELLTSYFNGLGGPLFGLRENSGYAYQVSFSHQPRQDVGTLVFTITLGNHVHGKDQWVRSGFDRVIRHVAKGKITHEEVLRAFYSLRGMKGLMMQNRLDETFQIALYERFGLGFEKYFEESKLELTDASVLKESMVRVASRYLFDQPSVFIKVGSAS